MLVGIDDDIVIFIDVIFVFVEIELIQIVFIVFLVDVVDFEIVKWQLVFFISQLVISYDV